MFDTKIKEGESKEAFIHRIYSHRIEIGGGRKASDEELGEICRKELGESFDESAYRKPYQYFERMFDAIKDQFYDPQYIQKIEAQKDELYKQQVKTRDQTREKYRTLKDEARIEVMIEAIRQSAESYPAIKPIYRDEITMAKDGAEGILTLSDWHVGSEIDNFRNKFNEQILEKRVSTLVRKTIKYCMVHNVTKLTVINAGDILDGLIHTSLRLESEFDVIEQVKKASSLIYQLLINLSENFKEVSYRSVLDNHSRVIANKHEHVEKESFSLLVDWWLEAKLEGSRVQIIKDNLDENIGLFQLNNGKNVFFVHGHLDPPATVTQNLTFGTGFMADITILAHYHADKMKTFQGKRVYLAGSLRGTDSFALNHRMFGDPTQMLLIFDEDEIVDIRLNL